MPKIIISYIRFVDRMNRYIGRAAMYGLFVMVAILLYSIVTKAVLVIPPFWTLEMAQFALVAYYLLGGPYSIQLGANVRMDLFYGKWSYRQKAWIDSITIFMLIAYLIVLIVGGIDSTSYAFEYQERSPTLWRPLMWPIKVIMLIGFFLMLLQAFSELFKDIAKLRRIEI